MIEDEDEDDDEEEEEKEGDDVDDEDEETDEEEEAEGNWLRRGRCLFGRGSESGTRGGSTEAVEMRHAASMETALMAQSVEGFDGAIGEAIWVGFRCSGAGWLGLRGSASRSSAPLGSMG